MTGYRGMCSFPPTQWTMLIQKWHCLDEQLQQRVREEFCKRYRNPVWFCVRQNGVPEHDAEDVVQGFFADKIFGKSLPAKADRAKGRFRDYLRMVLRNYVSDWFKKKKRQPVLVQGASYCGESAQPIPGLTPEEVFDHKLVSDLVLGVITEVREWYCGRGKTKHWEVFQARRLWEIMAGDAKTPYEKICKDLAISKKDAQRMLVVANRQFKNVLRKRVRALVASVEDVEPEIREMARSLLRHGHKQARNGPSSIDSQSAEVAASS